MGGLRSSLGQIESSRTGARFESAGQSVIRGRCPPETDVWVDDDLCDTDEDTYSRFWLHHSSALIYPAVGAVVGLTLGSFIRPATGRVLDRGAPTSGGRVLRGGFGGLLPSGGS
ncbi:hypothetical protein AB0I30_24585 [Nocardia tengchongensis]|uniref:hypothetical protein n=1 Tax=Nocardia tengchongensis TaxID=2055889 RepID=UPI0033CC55F0